MIWKKVKKPDNLTWTLYVWHMLLYSNVIKSRVSEEWNTEKFFYILFYYFIYLFIYFPPSGNCLYSYCVNLCYCCVLLVNQTPCGKCCVDTEEKVLVASVRTMFCFFFFPQLLSWNSKERWKKMNHKILQILFSVYTNSVKVKLNP